MEWHNVDKKLPKDMTKKYLVKTKNGLIKLAFFMPDRAMWRAWYGQTTSHWLETPSAELVLDVIEWSENEHLKKSTP